MRWKGETLPEKLSEIKMKGFMGSLGKKQGFVHLGDTTVTGRIARLMKSGLLCGTTKNKTKINKNIQAWV